MKIFNIILIFGILFSNYTPAKFVRSYWTTSNDHMKFSFYRYGHMVGYTKIEIRDGDFFWPVFSSNKKCITGFMKLSEAKKFIEGL